MKSLTAEQKKRIEENKNRAKALRDKARGIVNAQSTAPTASSGSGQTTNAQQSFSGNYNNRSGNNTTQSSSHSSANKSISTFTSPNKNGTTSVRLIPAHSVSVSTKDKWSPSKMNKRKEKSCTKGQCILLSHSRFELQCPYSAAVISVCKSIETKQYNVENKRWSFDLKSYQAFMQHMYQLGEAVYIEPLPTWILSTFSTDSPPQSETEVDISTVAPNLDSTLFPFQKAGVRYAIKQNGKVLIADDMGLGKTLQAIAIACHYRSDWPVLVICPSSVRYSWREQLIRWVPSLTLDLVNVPKSAKDCATSGLVNVISYDLMTRRAEELAKKLFKVIIMDESHLIKNAKTARATRSLPLLHKARRCILLSGTPALSRPSELFTQIRAVAPRLFPNFHAFGLRYCEARQSAFGWDYSGACNLRELQLLLEKHVMIRRLKKDVLSELPAKTRQLVTLDPNSVKMKSRISHKQIDNLWGDARKEMMMEYFHYTCEAKVSAVCEFTLDLLESGRKFLLFAHHQRMMDEVEAAVDKKDYRSIRIDGRTGAELRNQLCEQFQTDADVKIAILSITAANAGLNLTEASSVVFAELYWNPGILVQAEDRVHRIGQKDAVVVTYLHAQGTADDYIWPLVQEKLAVLGKVGLSKEDFADTETTSHTSTLAGKQADILSYFAEAFAEEMEIPESPTADHVTDLSANQNGVTANNDGSKISTEQYATKTQSVPDLSEVSQNSELPENWDDDDDDFDDPDAPWPKRIKR